MKILFIRFLLVGIINTAFGYGCFALLVYFGFHYSFALLISVILGVMFNFKSTGTFVFKSSDNRLIFRYFFVYGIVYVVNVLGIEAILRLGFTAYVGAAILLLPMAVFAFVLQKRFVFLND